LPICIRAGKLGKRLARVESLMHSGDALPRVGPQTKMPDVIYEMSRKKLGVTAVVEGERLVGIISDGDLRRLLEKRGKDVMDLSAGEGHEQESEDDPDGRIRGDGAGVDGREEDNFANGGEWKRQAGKGLCTCTILWGT
jgi:CBS domain-containing protein